MMIEDDPVIDRIHETRKVISQKHDNDPHKIVEYYMNLKKKMNLTVFDPLGERVKLTRELKQRTEE